MNILGMGVAELILVMIIALIVAGPQRLARWAYVLGRLMGQAREMWSRMMEGVQKEFDDAGLDIKLPKDFTNRGQMRRFADEALRPLREPVQQAMDEYRQEAKQLETTIRQEAEIDMTNLSKPANGADAARAKAEETDNGRDTGEQTESQPEPKANGQQEGYGTWSGVAVPRGGEPRNEKE